jgi:hypothetical protein
VRSRPPYRGGGLSIHAPVCAAPMRRVPVALSERLLLCGLLRTLVGTSRRSPVICAVAFTRFSPVRGYFIPPEPRQLNGAEV